MLSFIVFFWFFYFELSHKCPQCSKIVIFYCYIPVTFFSWLNIRSLNMVNICFKTCPLVLLYYRVKIFFPFMIFFYVLSNFCKISLVYSIPTSLLTFFCYVRQVCLIEHVLNVFHPWIFYADDISFFLFDYCFKWEFVLIFSWS